MIYYHVSPNDLQANTLLIKYGDAQPKLKALSLFMADLIFNGIGWHDLFSKIENFMGNPSPPPGHNPTKDYVDSFAIPMHEAFLEVIRRKNYSNFLDRFDCCFLSPTLSDAIAFKSLYRPSNANIYEIEVNPKAVLNIFDMSCTNGVISYNCGPVPPYVVNAMDLVTAEKNHVPYWDSATAQQRNMPEVLCWGEAKVIKRV